MPHSTRTKIAKTRATFTGERVKQAESGVGRYCHGLDDCSAEQRALRAQFALRMFNASSSCSRLLLDTMVVSPRWDCLTFHTNMIEHTASRFFGSDLQFDLDFPPDRTASVNLHHRATGGMLRLEDDSLLIPKDAPMGYSLRDRVMHEWELRDKDERPTEALVEIEPDAQILLAALITRYKMAPQHAKWTSTIPWRMSWLRDPAAPLSHFGNRLELTGHGHHWVLIWDTHPMLETILTALTHPVVGLKGLEVEGTPRHDGQRATATLAYGDATLHLAHHRDAGLLPVPLSDLPRSSTAEPSTCGTQGSASA